MCHRLQKVNNDLQDKEGGLVATLNSIKIEGHEREATEEEGVEAENAEGRREAFKSNDNVDSRLQKLTTWYGTANLDSLSMSFMLDIEDKIKDRIWFEKQATSGTVAVEIPGVNCLAMYAPHTQAGNLRVECQGIQASFDASIIRLLVSMHRSWIVSGSEKRKNIPLHTGSETKHSQRSMSMMVERMIDMINHDVDDRHFAVDVVLFVETGKCIVWDHGRTKELFSVDLPEVHANSIIGLGVENNYEYVDVRGITHVIWSPVHVTPIVMFLSELISEIRDMDHSLKRELFEAYITMGLIAQILATTTLLLVIRKTITIQVLGMSRKPVNQPL